MAGREVPASNAGPSLPIYDRLGGVPPLDFIARRIEALTSPGDVVVDLHGRGGWIARSAVDRQRAALSIETSPLTRLLAEVVLRPPDLRHLDAAVAAIGTAPRGDGSIRSWITDRWTTRCPSCERSVVLEELIWEQQPSDPDGLAVPTRRTFSCAACRDPRTGREVRHLAPDDTDHSRARDPRDESDANAVRAALRERFPSLDAESTLPDELLDLHSPRQLAALGAILERVEGELRAAPITAALRIAFVHAVLPASRLNAHPGRMGSLRIAHGRLRTTPTSAWRERNPWLAFEDAYRLVRAFLQRLEASPLPPVQARYASDVRGLAEPGGSAVVRLATPSSYRALATDAAALDAAGARDRVRLLVAVAPPRPTPERLALAYHATAWALGREAAQLLPLEPLFGSAPRAGWGWESAALRRSLAATEPLLSRQGRAVVLVEDAPEAAASVAVAAAGAKYRIADLRPLQGETAGTVVELVPPGAAPPPGPRSRANRPLEPVRGGAGDPELVPGPGLFSAPEPVDGRPFSPAETERTIAETAIETLKVRGEPAPFPVIMNQVLVALDRVGQLRRYALANPDVLGAAEARGMDRADASPIDVGAEPPDGTGPRPDGSVAVAGGDTGSAEGASPARPRGPAVTIDVQPVRPSDAVDRLVSLVRDELGRPTQRRIVAVGEDRWWLGNAADREAAAAPLADRIEWATYSLLSTAGPMSEAAFSSRIAALFRGADLPEEDVVRAALDSYRSRASTSDRLVTNDDLLTRTHEHAELLALLAETGHRLNLSVWIAEREQERRIGGRLLGDWLDPRERTAYLGGIAGARAEVLADVDVIWYLRGHLALLFEVEWTAMLGEAVLGRHGRIPGSEDVARFLVIPSERTELLRAKLEHSPVARDAFETQNWHVLKWNHLRTFVELDRPTLDGLEPFVGLDPSVERRGEQLPLFEAAQAAAE